MRENGGVSANYVRVYLSKLVKERFVIKTPLRGMYLINPKFGIKGGAITENTYKDLVVVKKPGGRIAPNGNFEKEGGAE